MYIYHLCFQQVTDMQFACLKVKLLWGYAIIISLSRVMNVSLMFKIPEFANKMCWFSN